MPEFTKADGEAIANDIWGTCAKAMEERRDDELACISILQWAIAAPGPLLVDLVRDQGGSLEGALLLFDHMAKTARIGIEKRWKHGEN